MIVRDKGAEKQAAQSKTMVVKRYWNDFWSEENKRNRNKWLGWITFGIAVLLLLFVFFKLYRGWRPLRDDEPVSSMINTNPVTFVPTPLEEPECRPTGSSRLCFPDTTRNARVSFGDAILVDTAALPVRSTLCERSDTLRSSKVLCRGFEIHKE